MGGGKSIFPSAHHPTPPTSASPTTTGQGLPLEVSDFCAGKLSRTDLVLCTVFIVLSGIITGTAEEVEYLIVSERG